MSEPTTSTPISGTPLDKLTQDPAAGEQFVDKHQVKLIALALLLIIVAVVVVVQREIKKSQEETAGALLVSKSEAADLEGIIKNYEGTAAAGSATILLAEKQWEEEKEDEAIATLRGLVDSAEAHPAHATALASLAAKLRKQEKTSDAEKLLTEITEDTDARYMAAYAWIALGDIAAEKGDLEAAEKAYTTVEKDFSDNFHASQEAVKRRLVLKAESPVIIAAPLPPLDTKIIGGDGASSDDAQIKDLLDALKTAGEGPLPTELLEGNGADE